MHTEIMKQVEKMYRIMWKNIFIINMYIVFIEGTILKFVQIQFHVYQLYNCWKNWKRPLLVFKRTNDNPQIHDVTPFSLGRMPSWNPCLSPAEFRCCRHSYVPEFVSLRVLLWEEGVVSLGAWITSRCQ